MAEKIRVTLHRNDLRRLVDGLDVLIQQWEATAEYLETGEPSMDVSIRVCVKPEEAAEIVRHCTRVRAYLKYRLSQHE